MQAILTIGVSASGKSTWAADYIETKKNDHEKWLVINQDEIRLSLIKKDKGHDIDEVKELKSWNYDPEGISEKRVKDTWDDLVKNAIRDHYEGIIISDTNLDGGFKKMDKLISFGIDSHSISTQMFPISFEEALSRDTNRKFSVGEAVLKMQFEKLDKFLASQPSNHTKLKI